MSAIAYESLTPVYAEHIRPLVEFLSARIAEDEAAARAASQPAFAGDGSIARWRDEPHYPDRMDGHSTVWNGVGQAVVSNASDFQGAHIARQDPARVLAGCESKREIIALAEFSDEEGAAPVYVKALRALTLSYADHPDYQQIWGEFA